MSNNAKVGGILSIVSGALGLFPTAIMIFIALVLGVAGSGINWNYRGSPYYGSPPPGDLLAVVTLFYAVAGLILAALSVLAIVGGILAINRKHFGWSLAGTIASLFTFFPCGIPAVVFVSMGKSEFTPPWRQPLAPPPPPPEPPPASPPVS